MMNINQAPIPTESEEQQALFRWASWKMGQKPELALLYHIPNEGKRSKTQGARLKREGLSKGIPDICLPVPHGRYSSLYIELKRQKGSSATKEQKEKIELLNKYGCYARVCKGWEEAAKVIEWYMELGGALNVSSKDT